MEAVQPCSRSEVLSIPSYALYNQQMRHARAEGIYRKLLIIRIVSFSNLGLGLKICLYGLARTDSIGNILCKVSCSSS